MDVLLIGTGGVDGWPQDGCHCASCMRARASGRRREPGRVLLDGQLEICPDQNIHMGTRSSSSAAHQITQVSGGWDITGPDGSRLLLAAGPGQIPTPLAESLPFDVALLDVLAEPARIGWLRGSGVLRPGAEVVALYCDHRISSEREMDRRCTFWGVTKGRDGQLIHVRPTDPASGQAVAGDVHASPFPRPHRTLIIGGARSGKSTEAELRLSAEPDVVYLAAGPWAAASTDPASGQEGWANHEGAPDTEWAQRVAAHRARRPSWWQTVESLDIAGVLRREQGAILIDGIGTWLAAIMDEAGMWADGAERERAARDRAARELAAQDLAAQDLAAQDLAEQDLSGLGLPVVQPGTSGAAAIVADRVTDLISAWRETSALVVAVTDQVGSGLVPAYPAGRVFRDQLGWLNQAIAAESELNLQVVAGRVVTLPD